MQLTKTLLTIAFAMVVNTTVFAQTVPLSNAFAHNDYWHKHPLFDALNDGYTNIEADVHVYKDRLVVTHILPQLHHGRTLEDLYLRPLSNYIAANQGRVYASYDSPITLMIDIKSEADKTYNMLLPLLEKYRTMLLRVEDGRLVNGPVRIVLSGNKPYGWLQDDNNRLAFIDEDLRKVTCDVSTPNLFNMASCKYSKLLKWKGKGTLSDHDKSRLCSYVEQAHRMGARVRLWASPDNQIVWKQLLQCGVDLINTDKLGRLKSFLYTTQLQTSHAGGSL